MSTTHTPRAGVRKRVEGSVPGFVETVAQAESAEIELRRLPDSLTLDAAERELRERIGSLLAVGEPVPLDVAAEFSRFEMNARAEAIRAGILRTFASNVPTKLAGVRHAGVGVALDALQAELAQVVAAVRSIADVMNGASTAEEAISESANAAAAWARLAPLVHDYDEIRTLQSEFIRDAAPHEVASFLPRIGEIREAVDVAPWWVARRHDAASRSFKGSAPALAYVSWLRQARAAWSDADATGDTWWPQGSRETHLLRVCVQFTPWVPDLETTSNVYRLAVSGTADNNQEAPSRQERARAELYNLLGIDAGVDLTPTKTNAEADAEKAQRAFRKRLNQQRAESGNNPPRTIGASW